MFVSAILVICYFIGKIHRTKTYVKYVENKAVIMPLDVLVDCTFEQLGDMIYSRTDIDKEMFKLVLNYKYPLKSGKRFQPCPIWDDNSVYRMLKLFKTTSMEEIELYIEVFQVKPQVNQSVGAYTDLLVRGNDNVVKLDYDCGPNSAPVPDTNRCEVYGNDEYCEDEEANDESNESNGDIDVQDDGHVSYFHTLNQVLENEQGIHVSVDAASYNVSNNLDTDDPDESSPVQYHLAPSPQFEHVENFGNAISSDWTSWVKHTIRYSSGEFEVGQVFNSKSALQDATKIYSIKAHQEFVVVASSKKIASFKM